MSPWGQELKFFETAIIFIILQKLAAQMFAENSGHDNDSHTEAGEKGWLMSTYWVKSTFLSKEA